MSRLSALIPHDAAWSPRAQEDAGNFRCEGCVACEDCKFCRDCQQCRECTYCEACVQCQGCVQSRRCVNCHASSDLQDCRDCRGSSHLLLCFSCEDCVHCLGCVGLSGAQFCVLNQQLSQADYFAQVAALTAELETLAQGGWRIDRLGARARFARAEPPGESQPLAKTVPAAEATPNDGTCFAPPPLKACETLAPTLAAPPTGQAKGSTADEVMVAPTKVSRDDDAMDPTPVTVTVPDPWFAFDDDQQRDQMPMVATSPSFDCTPAVVDQDQPLKRKMREIEAQAQALAASAARNFDARLASLEQRRPRARAIRKAKQLAGQAHSVKEDSIFAPEPEPEPEPRLEVSRSASEPMPIKPSAKADPICGSHPQDPSRVSAWTPAQLPPRKRGKA